MLKFQHRFLGVFDTNIEQDTLWAAMRRGFLLVVGVLRGDGRPSLAEDHAGGQRDHQEEDQRDGKNTKQ